jgi:hypothetical protein
MSEQKRDLVIRKTDSGVEVDFINRRLGHRGEGVKLAKVTIVFPVGDATQLPDWFITPAANLTFIRFQDSSRDLTEAERVELDGHKFDAQQFWAERQTKKARGPVKITVEGEAKRIGGMTLEQKEALAEILKASDPDFAKLLKKK